MATLPAASFGQAGCWPLYPGQVYELGFTVMHLSTGDLNGDGSPDIVAVNWNQQRATVFLSRLDGTFERTTDLSPGDYSSASAIADFNNDGKPDIAIASGSWTADSGKLEIFTNGGGATFGSHADYAADLNPVHLAVADFDDDGAPDVVMANRYGGAGSNGSITVHLNDGRGAFPTKLTYTEIQWPQWIAAADLDGDGHPDFAVAGYNNEWAWYRNDGKAGFTLAGRFTTAARVSAVGAKDLNGDGMTDIVATTSGSEIWFNQGGGSFVKNQTVVSPDSSPDVPAFADINGDGLADLVVSGWDYGYYFPGEPGGRFGEAILLHAGIGPQGLTVGDFNRDGWTDVALGNYYSGGMSVLLNRAGTLDDHITLPARRPVRIKTADMNADGHADLLAVTSSQIQVYLGDGAGGFRAATGIGIGATDDLVVEFLDDDPFPDVAVVRHSLQQCRVYFGQGDGSFYDPIPLSTGPAPVCVAAADLDGDGHKDLAVGDDSDSTISVFRGLGWGVFADRQVVKVDGRPATMAGGVFGSAKKGRMLVAFADGRAATMFGDGAGGFVVKTFGSGVKGGWIALGDLNSDGILDAAVGDASFSGASARILLGGPDGSFSFGQVAGDFEKQIGVAMGDVNGDGNMDLLTTASPDPWSDEDGWVAVYLGDGSGSVASGLLFQTGDGPVDVAAADFNGDGLVDAATVDDGLYGGDIGVLLTTTACARCRSDCTRDGQLTPDDFVCMQAKWLAGEPYADYNRDGKWNINDFIAFQAEWRRVREGGGCE